MPKNKNPSNSFSPAEIRFIRQLFMRLLQGADVRVMLHNGLFSKVHRKFISMGEKVDAYEKKASEKRC